MCENDKPKFEFLLNVIYIYFFNDYEWPDDFIKLDVNKKIRHALNVVRSHNSFTCAEASACDVCYGTKGAKDELG